ncbi:MAG: hypothetical protein P4N41_12660 [Negativicutes bacterium]|nr:hypothetical protein [Negativicutes bacterium]
MKAGIVFWLGLFLLTGCAPAAGQPLRTVTPAARQKATVTLTPQASATMPAATLTPLPTPHITQIPTPTANAAGLIILKRQIEHLQTGPLSFVTETGQKLDEAALQQGSQLSAETPDAAGYGLATEYQGSLLTAVQNFNHDYSQGWVTVAQDGRVIYQIYTGPASLIFSLRGLYSFAPCATCTRHWMLETAFIDRNTNDSLIDDQGIGQLVEDGTLINKKYGYQTAFNFQTLDGKPFYFFQRIASLKSASTIDAWYNGLIIPLGFDEIPHYGCGDASELNPRGWADRLVFFARRGQNWYFVQISVM